MFTFADQRAQAACDLRSQIAVAARLLGLTMVITGQDDTTPVVLFRLISPPNN